MAQGRKVADRDREIVSNREIAFVEGGIESLKTTLKFYMDKWKKGYRGGRVERTINLLEEFIIEDMVVNHIQFCDSCPEKPDGKKDAWRARFDQEMRTRMAESYDRTWKRKAERFMVLLDPEARIEEVLPLLERYYEIQQEQYLKLKNYDDGGKAQKAKLMAAFLKRRPEILGDLEKDMEEHGWNKECQDEKIERLYFHLDHEAAMCYAKGMGLVELWKIEDEKKFAKTAEKHIELYINAKRYERSENRRMQLILHLKPELQKLLLEELKLAHVNKLVDFGGDTDVAAHWINALFETSYEKIYQMHEAEFVDIMENRYSEKEWMMLVGGFFARHGWESQFGVHLTSFSGEVDFEDYKDEEEELYAESEDLDEKQLMKQRLEEEMDYLRDPKDTENGEMEKAVYDNKVMLNSSIGFYKDNRKIDVSTGEVLSEMNIALSGVVEEFQDKEKVVVEMERYGFDPDKRAEWIERFLMRCSVKVRDQLIAFKREIFGGKYGDKVRSLDAISAVKEDESDGLRENERFSLVADDNYKSEIIRLKTAYAAMVHTKQLIQPILQLKITPHGIMQFVNCVWIYPHKEDGIAGIVKGYAAQRTNYPPQIWNDYHEKELANMRIDMSEQLDKMMEVHGFEEKLEREDYENLDHKLDIWNPDQKEQLIILRDESAEAGYQIVDANGQKAADDADAEYHRLYGEVMKEASSVSKDISYRKRALEWDGEELMASLETEMRNSLAEVIDDGRK